MSYETVGEMPAEVAGSSLDSVCIPVGRVCGAITSGGSGRGSGASGGGSRRLPTFVLLRASTNDHSRVRTPQANNEFPNANIENIMERSR